MLGHPGWWLAAFFACAATLLSLGLRALRWIFLLRRSGTRIPIRDAYIGYLAGFSLLLAPFLLGEIAVRAYVLKRRGNVPIDTTIVVNVWERLLDLVALAGIAGTLLLACGQGTREAALLLAPAAVSLLTPVRRACLTVLIFGVQRVVRLLGGQTTAGYPRLASLRVWCVGIGTGLVAWSLVGAAFWALAAAAGGDFRLDRAQLEYAQATLAGALTLAPGGILVAGGRMLRALQAAGYADGAAALTVFGIRLATAGLSTALGVICVLVHARLRPAGVLHFDEIADAYDVQIPKARRDALLVRKTDLMREVLEARVAGRQGLDVGCGQGWYVARMRTLGFDVVGIDTSPGQLHLAARHLGQPNLVREGSALHIPAADASYDFVYSVNVLHHLATVAEQRAAFAEVRRVLRPGGLVFLHEINTRNVIFRFYMGYVFPSLNCIDEGVERWILPHRLGRYTDMPVIDARYFTFLPDFTPAAAVKLLGFVERRFEASPFCKFSAHYMAVLQKPL